MKNVIASAALLTLLAGTAWSQETQEKGGKLPWYKGSPQKGLAHAKKEGRNAFLYFTSKG